jgi:hypothetical protein
MELEENKKRELRVVNRDFSLGEYGQSWTNLERYLFIEIYNVSVSPQYLFFKSGKLSNTLEALLPFILLIISLGARFGGAETNKCT